MQLIRHWKRPDARTARLSAGMALLAAGWILGGHVILGDLGESSGLLELAFDVAPIIILAVIGAAVGTRWDIARRRADASLSARERELRAVFDGGGVGIALIAPDGRLRKVNPALCAFLEYDPAELLATDFVTLTHPDDLPAELEQTARLVAGEIDRYGLDKRYLRRDGSIVWGRLTASAVRDASGSIVYTVKMIQDITVEKATEAELRTLAAAVEHTAETVVITDLDGRVMYVNPSFEKTLGYDFEELVDREPEELARIFGTNPADPGLWSTLLAGRTWTATLANERKGGGVVETDVVVTLVRDENGEPIGAVGVGRDVSAERQLQAQLEKAHRMEAVGQLAGGVAHDFNNLLTGIRGFAELHLAEHPEPGATRDDVLEVISATDRAAGLVRQLLAFARRQPTNPERFDLGGVVEATLPLLRQLVGEGIAVRVETDDGDTTVSADRGQVEQILLNLAANARDAMPGGGTMTIRVSGADLDDAFIAEHGGGRAGPHVVLTVEDDGEGMDDTTLARAFEPFFTTKEPGKGTGLGLASVYGIVKQAGGAIHADSDIGEGSRFTVYLPLVAGSEYAPARSPDAGVASPRPTETILVVEDSEPVRTFIERCLRSDGYEVISFSNPAAALDYALGHTARIDAVVTDVVMPGFSGPTLATQLGVDRPGLPVLFVTGHDPDSSGATSPVLAKPFTRKELADAVGRLLGSVPAADVTQPGPFVAA